MIESIILLDVDKTLLDTDYELTVDRRRFVETVDRAQDLGFRVGLNSDSPFHTLRERAVDFGLTGPLIAERGAVVAASPFEEPVVTIRGASRWSDLRSRLIQHLNQDEHSYHFVTGVTESRDLTQMLSQMEGYDEGTISVLVSAHRQASFALWVRRRKNRLWTKDAEALDEVTDLLGTIGPSLGTLWEHRDEDRNPEYGILILHDRRTRKRVGLDAVRTLLPGASVSMVGDSMADWLDDARVDHYAVANAHTEFKELCRYVATLPITEGVVEVIERIIARSNRP